MEQEARFNIKPGLLASAAVIAVMLGIAAAAWIRIPEGQPVAIHWGINGQPDGFAGKTFALFFFPVLAFIEACAFAIIANVEPRRRNIKLSHKAYTVIWVMSLVVTLLIHGFLTASAVGLKLNVAMVMSVAVGLLYIVMGNYLPKLRSNFFAGIRTPWTLSSELSWSKTHRLGGRLFIIYGLVMLIAGFLLEPSAVFAVLIIGIFAVILFLTAYSYVIWKSDVSRNSASGGAPANAGRTNRWVAIIAVSVVVLVTAIVFVAVKAQAPSNPSVVIPPARALVRSMVAGDFEAATRDFDAIMKGSLSPEKLKSTWDSLTPVLGPYQRELSVKTEKSWPFTAVLITCHFEKKDAVVKVVYGPSGKVSGLWINPAQ